MLLKLALIWPTKHGALATLCTRGAGEAVGLAGTAVAGAAVDGTAVAGAAAAGTAVGAVGAVGAGGAEVATATTGNTGASSLALADGARALEPLLAKPTKSATAPSPIGADVHRKRATLLG